MKCYTVNDLKKEAKITLVERTRQRDGKQYRAIELGEHGRGRTLGIVPYRADVSSVYSAEIVAGEKNCILRPTSKIVDEILVKVYVKHGYRGTTDLKLTNCDLLAEGTFADGIAGRMASSKEILVVMRPGSIVEATRTGRLYGGPEKVIIMCTSKGLDVFDPDLEVAL